MQDINFCEFNYGAEIGLTLVSTKQVDFLNDSVQTDEGEMKVQDFIRMTMEAYTATSMQSVTNAKAVDINTLKINKRSISFKLHSMEEVEGIGRSMKLFSQLLLKTDYFDELRVKNKLFKSFIPADLEEYASDAEVIDTSQIADEELVKALIDMLVKPEYMIDSKQRKAINEMKSLAVSSKIIDNLLRI